MKTDYHAIFRLEENSVIKWHDHEYRCALGKNGVIEARSKKEGDNKSPLGQWAMRRVFYRPDRVDEPITSLQTMALTDKIGWSDDPRDQENYNKLVTLPYPFSHEKLWREDEVYNIIVELGYNDAPAIPGKGSAIFMHIKRSDYEGTEGCVALAEIHLRQLLKNASPGDTVKITHSQT